MADGSKKAIERIQPGDRVVATDPETRQRAHRTVTHVWAHHDSFVTLHVGNESIVTTEDHSFWSASDRTFKRADDLSVGENVLGDGWSTVVVRNLGAASPAAGMAYNLSIDGIHTYHVGTAAILVHNDCGPTAPPSAFTRTESLSGRGSAREVKEIASSMASDGWQGPPIDIVEHQGMRIIVDGHHRVAAARVAGIEVPYRSVDVDSVLVQGKWGSLDEIMRDVASVRPDRIR